MAEITLNDLLQIANPAEYKLHLACRAPDGAHPLDEYVADSRNWVGWNEWRGQKNDWTRPRILAFIEFYPQRDLWLFGGGFQVLSRQVGQRYQLGSITEWDKYVGRLLVKFHRVRGMRGRAFYLESYLPELKVTRILEEAYSGESFPGFEKVEHDFSTLEALMRIGRADWQAALQSVKGVYLIADKLTGRLYVGSAYGGEGIWSRWAAYVGNGHGGNVELADIIGREGVAYARNNFKLSILEVMANSTPDQLVVQREAHWKRALLSREPHGYNRN